MQASNPIASPPGSGPPAEAEPRGRADGMRLWRRAAMGSSPANLALARRLADGAPGGCLDFLIDGAALTPLIAACIADNPALARALVDWGARPDFPDEIGWTPLHWCATSGRERCAAVLLELGADPNALRPGETATPLHMAAQSSALACAALLSRAGARWDAVDASTGACAALWGAHDPAFAAAVGADGAIPPDMHGRGALHWASRQACSDELAAAACRFWLARGADPLARDRRGSTPIDAALWRGYSQCAGVLASWAESSALDGCLSAGRASELARL